MDLALLLAQQAPFPMSVRVNAWQIAALVLNILLTVAITPVSSSVPLVSLETQALTPAWINVLKLPFNLQTHQSIFASTPVLFSPTPMDR